MATPAGDVLAAMITPAVLISAAGTLVLSTSNRLGRIVDRVRVLSAEVERYRAAAATQVAGPLRKTLIASQLQQLARRVLLLRTALTSLYTAIGLLVATSLVIGVTALVPWSLNWVAIGLGLTGACALFRASLVLVREGRLAILSTLEEMDYAREVVGAFESSRE